MHTIRNRLRLHPGEAGTVALSALCIFCVLCGHYILRAIRDEIGAENIDDLHWLWTGTFFAMLVAVPLYSALVSRFPRRTFIAMTYRFFAVCLLVFFVLFREVTPGTEPRLWTEAAFYIWQAVFSLFVVMVFWSLMSDVWNSEQGRRLYGLIAFGGTLGGMFGSFLTWLLLVERVWVPLTPLHPSWLLLAPIALLEAGVWCTRGLDRRTRDEQSAQSAGTSASTEPVRGSMWSGFIAVVRSPYLLAIAGFLFMHTLTGTFMYFEQSEIVKAAITDRSERVVLFAQMDLAVNGLTLLGQGLLAGWLMTRLGVAFTLVLLPIIVACGFAALAIAPVLAVIVIVQVARRAGNYALARPAREVLYTVVQRDERYKAKSFIDTALYRGGDVLSAWVFKLFRDVYSLSIIAMIAIPIALVWAGLAVGLGRAQRRRAESPE